jgi:hypothetical protein
MSKREKFSYIFLIISLLLLYEAYHPIINLISFNFNAVSNHSLSYKIGLLIGEFVRVFLDLGLSIYFFKKFMQKSSQPGGTNY